MSLWKRFKEPKRIVNPKILDLETAEEILAEVFHTWPVDIDDMIRRRIEERSLPKDIWLEEAMVEDFLCGRIILVMIFRSMALCAYDFKYTICSFIIVSGTDFNFKMINRS